MSALVLKLRATPPGRIDLSAVIPSATAGKSIAEIERFVVGGGRVPIALADVFAVSGDPAGGDEAMITIEGATAHCDGIGAELDGGTIIVDGDAGMYAGRHMKRGRLAIGGSAGAYLAAGLKNGLVSVKGRAGDFVGGVLPGDKNGMAGGSVVVEGDIGERAGDRMRRGTIVTRGKTGASAGSRMLGGTIVAEDGLGPGPGPMLRRGTLIAPNVARMLATFGDCGRHDLGILKIMNQYFAKELGPLAPNPFPALVRRFAGDLATGGKGEILLLA